jgi:hypothetical protein
MNYHAKSGASSLKIEFWSVLCFGGHFLAAHFPQAYNSFHKYLAIKNFEILVLSLLANGIGNLHFLLIQLNTNPVRDFRHHAFIFRTFPESILLNKCPVVIIYSIKVSRNMKAWWRKSRTGLVFNWIRRKWRLPIPFASKDNTKISKFLIAKYLWKLL